METETPPGLSRELQRVREGTAATAADLKAFMQQMRGRSPAEVMGTIAQSSLIRSTFVATIAVTVLMGICTAGPYFWNQWSKAQGNGKTNATAQAGTTPTPDKTTPSTPAPNAVSTANPPATTDTTPAPGAKKKEDDILSKLGVGETKETDPNKNPLDKDDDLLKEFK